MSPRTVNTRLNVDQAFVDGPTDHELKIKKGDADIAGAGGDGADAPMPSTTAPSTDA